MAHQAPGKHFREGLSLAKLRVCFQTTKRLRTGLPLSGGRTALAVPVAIVTIYRRRQSTRLCLAVDVLAVVISL